MDPSRLRHAPRAAMAVAAALAIHLQLLLVAIGGAAGAASPGTGLFDVICVHDGATQRSGAPSAPSHDDHDGLCCLACRIGGDAAAAALPSAGWTFAASASVSAAILSPAQPPIVRKRWLLPVGSRAPPALIG
jgi:hypothetical protein